MYYEYRFANGVVLITVNRMTKREIAIEERKNGRLISSRRVG